MAATPYRPVSWSDRALNVEKLNQMANNEQWLFENAPRMRYSYSNSLVRDSGIKIIAGKTPYGTAGGRTIDVWVMFGNFFSATCKPIVNAAVEPGGFLLRKYLSIRGIGGEIDNRGFLAHVVTHETATVNQSIEVGGFVHWTAVGF